MKAGNFSLGTKLCIMHKPSVVDQPVNATWHLVQPICLKAIVAEIYPFS